jgi:hypothetical protein
MGINFTIFNFYREAYEAHEVKRLKKILKIFIFLRALCGEKASLKI